jgi:class 3 adenylate cyclase
MNSVRIERKKLEHLIEAMDRPLLILAIVTLAFYLLDLKAYLGPIRPVYQVFTVFIDVIFVVDLSLKIYTFGRDYFRTPWFLIDALSCLPIIDLLAKFIPPLRAIRFIRVFRLLRILRTLRVLRALRTVPGFEQFIEEASAESGSRFHMAMNLGVIGTTTVVFALILAARLHMEWRYEEQIDAGFRYGAHLAYFAAIGGSLRPPADGNYFERRDSVDGEQVTLYFSLDELDERTNEIEFFLILGMMITICFLMYITRFHHTEVTQTQLRALLNLALPRQVAEQFVIDPEVYEKKSKAAATIMFMDFVGFTQTCEALSHDPDLLSTHLEQAMDRLVGELIRHDLIIDKFIGDAVMTFRGGPLATGTPSDHAYRAVRAAVDSIKALAALGDPYFHRVKIGGASSDDCLIGAFGTSGRLSYTILGDSVNVAARLEPASAQCGTQNLFCDATYHLCADRSDIVWRRWGQVRLVGRVAPIIVYEAFDHAALPDWSFVTSFHRGLEAFERGDFDRARDLFLQADAQRLGGDEPSRSYVGWCEGLLLEGAPMGWEPVFETHK